MDEKQLAASLKTSIQKWVDAVCCEETDSWIKTLFPSSGVDLMTDAAMAVLKAIESSAEFTESEHVD